MSLQILLQQTWKPIIPFNKVNYRIQKVRSHLKSQRRNSESSINLNDRFASTFYQSAVYLLENRKDNDSMYFPFKFFTSVDKPEKNLRQSYEYLYLC